MKLLFEICFISNSVMPFIIQLNWMARTLLANTQGGPLEPLQAAPKQRPLERDICALMVHTAVVFITRKDTELLSPFVNMLNNPAALVVCRHIYRYDLLVFCGLLCTECISSNNA